jgi:hypothetical protein
VVTPGRSTIALSIPEIEMIIDALWYWTASPGGVQNQKAVEANELRRKLLKLDLINKGWGPAENALADLLPEST